MRKWLILAGVVLAAVAIVAIAVVNLESYLNENKGWLEEQAAAVVGRPVAFERVGVGLWPGLAIDVEDLRIADDPAYAEQNLLEVDEIRVRVDLWSAVFGDLDVSGIALERPTLNVIRTRDGLNLDTLGAAPAEGAVEETASEASTTPLAAVIAFLEIGHGEIHYLDRTTDPPSELRIEQLDFEAEDVGLTRPLRFSLAASVLAKDDTQNLRIEGTAGPIALELPQQTPVDVRIEGSWVADERLAKLADLEAMGVTLAGDVALAGTVSGTLERLVLDLALDASKAALRYEESFDKPAGTPLAIQCAGTLQGGALEIEDGALVIADATIDTTGRLDTSSLAYDLALESLPINLARREKLLPGLAGLGLAGSVALDLNASAAGPSQGLPKLKGAIALANVEVHVPEQPPVTGFSGTIELRDGGAFMAAAPLQVGDAAGTLAVRVPDLAAPVAHVDLKSRAGSYSDVRYESLDVAVVHTVATSITEIARMRVVTFGGEVSATGRYDASNAAAPVLILDSRVSGLQLEQLLASHFDPGVRVLEGKLGSELRIRGVGADWEALKSTLTGAGAVSLDDGVLRKVNLGGDLIGQLANVPGLQLQIPARLESQYPAVFGRAATQFENLRAKLSLKDGRVFADDLRLVAADYAIDASGSVSLDADVDLRASFSASKKLSQSLIDEANALRYLRGANGRIEIPFLMRGGATALRLEPDVQNLASRVAPALVSDLIGKFGAKKSSKKRDDSPDPDAGAPAAKSPAEEKDPEAAEGAPLRDLLKRR